MDDLKRRNQNNEDKLLAARVADMIRAARRPAILGFLNLNGQQTARKILKESQEENFTFWGGYEGAERAFLGVFAPGKTADAMDFPIQALCVSWKGGALTHRDFLGALLSLGIRREKIGDIIPREQACFILLDSGVADFVKQSLVKVGGERVCTEESDLSAIRKEQSFIGIADTISSERLDCIVAALVNLSRAQAAQLVAGGLVCVDFAAVGNSAARLHEGATVSIRGHGRFIIDQIGPVTKKGRLRLYARKYA